MIETSEIHQVASANNLAPLVVEKDYIIGWILAGIYNHPDIREAWVFKGGTCLKKCFFETYRFSEDLDFTLRDTAHLDETFLCRTLSDVAGWVNRKAGIDIPTSEIKAEVYTNKAGTTGAQAKIYFRDPLPRRRSGPGRIKIDLTTHEILVREPEWRKVQHTYSDCPGEGIFALTYDFPEVFAEKIRALVERTHPRDLYDVVNLHKQPEAQASRDDIQETLIQKCEFKGVAVPAFPDLEPLRDEVASLWKQMLDHQLPQSLPFESFWDELPAFFDWLNGK